MRRRVTTLKASIWLVAPLIVGLWLSHVAMVAAGGPEPGQRSNPYTGDPQAIKEGRALYLQYGCSGCHGVGGGGGMGPALLDDTWTFGSDDATLFKLIKGEVPQQTMPAVFGQELKDDEVWKILAYVRSLYQGDPSKVTW
ncbi:MAG TPA: c-type cytochrome [Alphaproteobacteria bacterium]|nr:c-type cytochrome [Alphaproteobacteria bacterium]